MGHAFVGQNETNGTDGTDGTQRVANEGASELDPPAMRGMGSSSCFTRHDDAEVVVCVRTC